MALALALTLHFTPVKDAFIYFDVEKKGRISVAKLGEAMINLGICSARDLGGGVLEALFKVADQNADGSLDYEAQPSSLHPYRS